MIKVAVLDDVREDLERARGLAEAFAKSAVLPMSVRVFENPFDLLDHIEKNGGFVNTIAKSQYRLSRMETISARVSWSQSATMVAPQLRTVSTQLAGANPSAAIVSMERSLFSSPAQ